MTQAGSTAASARWSEDARAVRVLTFVFSLLKFVFAEGVLRAR
jgi:hypothetical protein